MRICGTPTDLSSESSKRWAASRRTQKFSGVAAAAEFLHDEVFCGWLYAA